MRRVLLALMIACAAPAAATPTDDLHRLLEDHYQALLSEFPDTATTLGVRDYDDRIRDIGIEAREARVQQARAFLARLDAIPAEGLSQQDRVNRSVLRRMLSETIERDRFGQRDMIFNTVFAGWHQGFATLPRYLPFRTRVDYESYLVRIAQYPRMNEAGIAVTRRAIQGGFVLPCSVLGGYEQTISGLVAEDPTRSRFYEPFAGSRPAFVPAGDWAQMQARVRRIVTEILNPAYRRHLEFYQREYLPRCARSDSVRDLPGGADYYAFLIRSSTTTDLSARQIHDLGLREVARIGAEMDRLASETGHPDRASFIRDLRTNPRYFATTPDQMMREVARVAMEIHGHLPRLFGTLPRLPYTLREIPAETARTTATAYYNMGSPNAGLPGVFYVNTSLLEQRPLWDVPAITLHEAVPGHHLQMAIQQEQEMAPFRRNFLIIYAFTEGWGLYAESLGEQMGIYNTPERRMGRLSLAMWRACRLVVDTGIHALGWDRAQAIAYMREHTALTDANIEAEVNRYISMPGQALSYMIGAIRMAELRERAERALGERFDIRRFHDALLRNGSLPLDLLEEEIDRWIAAERSRT
ncbi:MAG: DUF885 family protein [Sphingomonas sp.]